VTIASFSGKDSAARRPAFGTKAATLAAVRPVMRTARVLPMVLFTVEDWDRNVSAIHRRIVEAFSGQSVIVRSSSPVEDTTQSSMAGRFSSYLNVPAADAGALALAIDGVIASYRTAAESIDGFQVLVQPMLTGVTRSGVLLTRGLDGAPYYILNYDDAGDTQAVTSGRSGSDRLTRVWRPARLTDLPGWVRSVIETARELEGLFSTDLLDIEFAESDDVIHLLQVRPMTGKNLPADESVGRELARTHAAMAAQRGRVPGLYGDRTLYSDMTDWNPAEMIGARPKQLAYSLYRTLITRSTWRTARARIGYYHPEASELMVQFGGHPYMDVRADFNSYLPAGLDPELAHRIINYYLDRLARYPHLHDKVEFEICSTCLTPDFDLRAEEMRLFGFTPSDLESFRDSLRGLTQGILSDRDGQFALMQRRMDQLVSLVPFGPVDPDVGVDDVAERIEQCRELGVEPFAVVVRAAFIGSALMRAMLSTGVIRRTELDAFYRSFGTIASDFSRAIDENRAGKRSLPRLLNEWGHLRPGTYEISTPTYRDRPDLYLSGTVSKAKEDSSGRECVPTGGVFSPESRDGMRSCLDRMGLQLTVDELLEFVQSTFRARETYKFQFSRAVSAILDSLVVLGSRMGVPSCDLSFIAVDELLELLEGGDSQRLRSLAADGRARWNALQKVVTPDFLTGFEDLVVVGNQVRKPNFVTDRKVVAPVQAVTDATVIVAGRIAFIESADPGYEWLFAQGISGLVTKFGGAASHMTIRCAEFGLPAAIGCGEDLFNSLVTQKVVELDCANLRVRAV
jgi:hypothetical protein